MREDVPNPDSSDFLDLAFFFLAFTGGGSGIHCKYEFLYDINTFEIYTMSIYIHATAFVI